MSNTVVIGFTKDSQLALYEEVPTAWFGAIRIWDALNDKYFNGALNLLNDIQPIWDLVNDNRITREERIVLMTTFDYMAVRRAHFKEVADALRIFDAENTKPDVGSNLSEQADIIEKMLENPDMEYLCWNQNDCCCEDWSNNFYDGNPYEEDTEEYDDYVYPAYDFINGTKHMFIFDYFK